MTDHDSWVTLAPGNPYELIIHLFPDGIPVRDPFPMNTLKTLEGKVISLWTIDLERLDDSQVDAICETISDLKGEHPEIILDDAISHGGFSLDSRWVAGLEIGPEGYARTLELREFTLNNPRKTRQAALAMQAFLQDQVERWIDGDEIPPPLPESIDEVPEELRTSGLEQAIKKNKVNALLEAGNYSVFDMLTGRAMTDVLNQIDPDNSYEVVPLDALFEDDAE